jgi:uncharacterized protein
MNTDQTGNAVRDVLAGHSHIRLGILFGSHAAQRARASSDVDVAVAAACPMNAAEKIGLIDDLAVRCGCPVDVVDLLAVGGAILHQALSKGRILVNKDPALLARLMLKMWYNQADMMPNYRMILRKRLEAFAHG